MVIRNGLIYYLKLSINTIILFIKIKSTLHFSSKPENCSIIFKNIYLLDKKNSRNRIDHPKFKVGDHVRIYKYKKHFEKGYQTNWTTEIFRVTEVIRTNPITYKIADLNGEAIVGSFYKEELLLSNCT